MFKYKTIIAGTCLLLGGQTLAYSSERLSWVEPEIDVGAEVFRWQEFDSDNLKILEEKGSRIFLIFKVADTNKGKSGFLHDISFKAYAGGVAYDGRTQPTNGNVPVETDTNYSGWNADLKIAYRMEKLVLQNDIDVIAGYGVDSWEREIESGIDANGAGVSGLTEKYNIAYARLGVGALHDMPKWRSYVEIGLKRPFETSEDVLDITLSPEGKVSFYASYKIISSKDTGNSMPFITIYYDSFRFGRSASKTSTVLSGNAHQPKSHMDLVGISLGRTF